MKPTSHSHLFNSACLSLSLYISLCLSLPYTHLPFMISHSLPPSHILYLSVHSFPFTPPAPVSSLTLSLLLPFTSKRSDVAASMFLNECGCSWTWIGKSCGVTQGLLVWVFTVIAKSKWSPPPRCRLLSPRLFYSRLGWCRLGIISKQGFKEANCFIILKPRLANLYVRVWCTDMLEL